jgi:hypothetical protein
LTPRTSCPLDTVAADGDDELKEDVEEKERRREDLLRLLLGSLPKNDKKAED